MNLYNFLLLLHILLFVYWLGTDVGVFYSSYFVLNRELTPQTRAQMAKLLLNLDLGPRICLVLIFPVGLSLASQMGISPITGGWLAAVWVAAVVWLGVVLTIHHSKGSRRGQILTMGDGIFRAALVVVLVVVAVMSLVGDGQFGTTWLPLKILMFAIAVASGLGIRVVLRPFGPAMGKIISGEGDQELAERELASSMNRTYPLVITIWVALVVAAALGVMKI